jgi:A/G-specific adenine glycosylase
MTEFAGRFPSDPVLLEQLKGIGRSTAGAIAAFAFHERAPILDANVKRILVRLFAIEDDVQEKATNDRLWKLASDLLPSRSDHMPVYTQAIMDFGATWCTPRKPVFLGGEMKCPFANECQANLSGLVLALPKKVIKAKSPELECDMLLMRFGNSVLLQKRPSKAIWGGLWSLPESSWAIRTAKKNMANPSLRTLFKDTLPEEKSAILLKVCKTVHRYKEIKHIFTHRRLWIQFWEVHACKEVKFSGENLKWVPLSQLGRYGLPQPIKLLLQGLSLVRGDDLKN